MASQHAALTSSPTQDAASAAEPSAVVPSAAVAPSSGAVRTSAPAALSKDGQVPGKHGNLVRRRAALIDATNATTNSRHEQVDRLVALARLALRAAAVARQLLEGLK